MKNEFVFSEKGKRTATPEIDAVINDLELLNQRWRQAVAHAKDFLAEIKSVAVSNSENIGEEEPDRAEYHEKKGHIYSAVEALECEVRYLALLQTHHEIGKTLGLD